MAIQTLEIRQFRNLKHVRISPSPGLNFFIGPNGSGKTSLLEAIHCLGRGKSFRTHKTNRLISDEAKSLLVLARVNQNNRNFTIGIERHFGESRIHLEGRAIHRTSELTQALPLAVIDPALHRLIEDGPEYRRKFLDWGVFHVEQGFHSIWSQYRRILAQRNAALKSVQNYAGIRAWDEELAKAAEKLNSIRLSYLHAFLTFIPRYTEKFADIADVSLSFYQGWREGESYSDYLASQFSSDKERRFTQYGPHRADLRIRIDGIDAREYLSRGQQKIFVAALILAQCEHLRNEGKSIVLLVDDLPSELDAAKRAKLMSYLSETEAQVFLTGTDQALFPETRRGGEDGLFHVKQGVVSG